MEANVIQWLCGWYTSHCDGDWEHQSGIKISTLDNPGWSVSIDLEDTSVEHREFARRGIDTGEADWLFCWREDKLFHAACSPTNLEQALTIFRDWVNE